jgi:hypothetical protein
MVISCLMTFISKHADCPGVLGEQGAVCMYLYWVMGIGCRARGGEVRVSIINRIGYLAKGCYLKE